MRRGIEVSCMCKLERKTERTVIRLVKNCFYSLNCIFLIEMEKSFLFYLLQSWEGLHIMLTQPEIDVLDKALRSERIYF